MDEARWGAVFQTVNGCAAHSSRRVLTRHPKTCSLVTLFTTNEAHLPSLGGKLAEGSDKSAAMIGNQAQGWDKNRWSASQGACLRVYFSRGDGNSPETFCARDSGG